MRPGSWEERVFRLLMGGYPRSFRDRFGADLLAVFREQRGEDEYRGLPGAMRFWREILIDWVKTMVMSRRSAGGVRGWSRIDVPGHVSREVVMEDLRRDLGFAVRSLWRAPGFTIVAVLTLAIGIGSNAAIFGVVRSVLMEPLPYGEPDEVVTIWSSWVGFPQTWVSENEYRAYLTGTRSFEDLAIWNETNVTFTDPSDPERVLGVGITSNMVDVLQVEPVAGRFFSEEEALRADSLPTDVIVISYEVWQRRWSGDPAIVGRSVEMNGRLREVVGVLPAGFRLPTQFEGFEYADVYFPRYVPRAEVTDFPEGGGSHGSYVVGRLRDGVDVDAASEDLEAVIDRLRADFDAYPAERAFRPIVYSAQDDIFGSIRPALLALFGAVVFVLLIACANVANLLLARSEERASELAVRTALGAGRRRLVRQLLVESGVLAAVGGLGGVGLAMGAVELFKRLNPGNLPRVDQVALDGGVLAFVALVTLGTALLFGVLPALRATGDGLKARMGRRAERGFGRSRWQGLLVVGELALAVVLVIGAGLMSRTFGALTAIDPGFDGDRVLTLAVSLPTTRYPDADAATGFFRETLERAEALPGVRSAAAIRSLPLASSIGDWGLDIDGYDEEVNPRAAGDWQIASPGYFETIGIPLVAGRDFDWNDDASGGAAVIVNEAFVRTYFANAAPVAVLGRTVDMGGPGDPMAIVGVVRDVKHNGLTAEIKPKFYVPVAQWGLVTGGIPTSLRLVLGTSDDPSALVQPTRDLVRSLDPSLAVAEIFTVDEVLSAAVAQPRFVVVLMGIFSGIALLLAVVGVYGVVSYGVGLRTQEIGVRVALGAAQGEVVGLMLRRGIGMIGIGLGLGLVLASGLGRFLDSLLYGVSSTDPITYAAVALVFGAVAAMATWIPSRRAARIDPIRALRME
ncbi:MAG: ABC transporter permease [Gemmatimonadota bacterium]